MFTRYWTDEEVDKLIALTEKGYTDKEIAEKLVKRSAKAVETKRLRMKISKGWDKEDVRLLKTLYNKNKTHQEMSDILGKTNAGVANKISRLKKKRA